ncbi:MAG: SLBB domain-containing protein, partial [Enterovibrio sp.]
GVTRYAAVEAIRVISNEVPTIFNLTKYLDSGDASLLPKITKGATIYVPKQEEDNKSTMSNTVHVMGEVEKQGSILAPEPVSLIELLADAGGTSRFADLSNTRIIKADGRTFVYDLAAYSEGKNGEPVPQVVAGDFVFVPEKSQELKPENTVRILGEVAKPGQIVLGDNMSLIDVIAYAGGPTFRADITKIEVTTPAANGKMQKYDFNLEAFMKEGLSEAKLPAIGAGSTVWIRTLPDDPVGNKSKWIQQGSDVSVYLFGQIGSPGRYRFNENMSILDLLAAADGPTGSADLRNIRITQFDGKQPKVTRFNMALFFETGDPALLPKIKIGDSVYVPDRNGNWLDKPKEQTVRVIGAVNQPGRYSFSDDMTILDLLAEAGGPSSAAYINKITVINYSNQRDQARTFDLAKFSRTANFDELPVLRAGDTIYIPSRDESLPQIIRQFMTDIFQMAGIAALVGLI